MEHCIQWKEKSNLNWISSILNIESPTMYKFTVSTCKLNWNIHFNYKSKYIQEMLKCFQNVT